MFTNWFIFYCRDSKTGLVIKRMSETISDQKNQLRKISRQKRQALGEPFRTQASLDICEHISNWSVFREAQVILTYFPIKSEGDLRPLITNFPHKHWVLPRIRTDITEHELTIHTYNPQQLVRHPFGMDEPAADLPTISPQSIELALVPGLAYDRQGWRLGYGGGYYDRFLARFPGLSLGICFEALLFDKLPAGEYDVPMLWYVTEKGLANSQP